jgi:GTP-dependent phosphoenolpyruvate carboxykinase
MHPSNVNVEQGLFNIVMGVVSCSQHVIVDVCVHLCLYCNVGMHLHDFVRN